MQGSQKVAFGKGGRLLSKEGAFQNCSSVSATNDSAIKLYSRTGYKPERITMAKEII